MFSKTAKYYDLIYAFKDYEKEAKDIKDLIKKEHPTAKSILDVACGTAEHAKYLSREFQIDGIDMEPEFVEIAQSKISTAQFWQADMSDFSLPQRYDVVQCLFSSIGYLQEEQQVVDALICFKNHLNPNGIILVEPWFTPEQWIVGSPHMVTVDLPDLKISRMNTSGLDGKISKIHFHYLIGKPERVEHLTEDHNLALYTVDEMLSFFEEAELNVHYDPDGIFGRGLYIAKS
ncbi:MAG: class I SAM-dependent methyltransferase [Chloroflexi bacterium]|nr:class I SAM-dependent methyltransferase [Chloroflexota bacterium]